MFRKACAESPFWRSWYDADAFVAEQRDGKGVIGYWGKPSPWGLAIVSFQLCGHNSLKEKTYCISIRITTEPNTNLLLVQNCRALLFFWPAMMPKVFRDACRNPHFWWPLQYFGDLITRWPWVCEPRNVVDDLVQWTCCPAKLFSALFTQIIKNLETPWRNPKPKDTPNQPQRKPK